jgi:hypothetical protein
MAVNGYYYLTARGETNQPKDGNQPKDDERVS